MKIKFFLIIFCLLICRDSLALESDVSDTFSIIESEFLSAASDFSGRVTPYAIKLFWILATLSMAWTAVEMGLKRAEFGEIVAELSKFIIVTGFFFYMVLNGTSLAYSIYEGLAGIAMHGATGQDLFAATSSSDWTHGVPDSPTRPAEYAIFVVSQGIGNAEKIIQCAADLSWKDIVGNLTLLITAILNLVIFLIIGLKLFLLEFQILCQIYAGCFFLGFGGGKWFRDTTIGYFKSIIATTSQYFAMLLIVGILSYLSGNTTSKFVKAIIDATSSGQPIFDMCFCLAVIPIAMMYVSATLPGTIANLFSGNFHNANKNMASSVAAMAGATASGVTRMTGSSTVRNAASAGSDSSAKSGLMKVGGAAGAVAKGIASFPAKAAGAIAGAFAARSENSANRMEAASRRNLSANAAQTPSRSLEQARQQYNGGNCSKKDEERALLSAQSLATNQNVPQNVRAEAGQLASSIAESRDRNESARLARGGDNTSLSQEERREHLGAMQTMAENWSSDANSPVGMLNSARQQYNGGNCSKRDEQAALMKAEQLANDADLPQDVRNEAQILSAQISQSQERNDGLRADNNLDQTQMTAQEKSDLSNQLHQQSDSWKETDTDALARRNHDVLGAMWDVTGGKAADGIRYAWQEYAPHPIQALRREFNASGERQYQRTNEKLEQRNQNHREGGNAHEGAQEHRNEGQGPAPAVQQPAGGRDQESPRAQNNREQGERNE